VTKGARIVLLDEHAEALRRHVFDQEGIEGAAFVLCGQARSDNTDKLLGHTVVPIADEDFLRRERDGLSISSRALTRIAKLARSQGLSVIFAHSHPDGVAHFSEQDDREEARLLPFLNARVPGRLHGTLVLTREGISGRLYNPQRTDASVFTVGMRLRLHASTRELPAPLVFDRQVRAFGADAQLLLSGLHVGIVGLGGTGSAVAELLYRLGVGRLALFDGDKLDETNISRVFGSTLSDVDTPKVEVTKQHLDRIGLATCVRAVAEHITLERTARELRDCDIVFGCTDRQLPRAILVQIALRYLIPVLDLGVLIDSDGGVIRGIHGRVTVIVPSEACLLCRGRISVEDLRVEALPPEERHQQILAGYAPGLAAPAPAVIPFTAATASAAVAELLHRLTGFMGASRHSSEILLAFDQSRVHTNRVAPAEGCVCFDRTLWGRGDGAPYLGMTWPSGTR
jgi:molybdopterin/thiamine biosynthesis adenylyltransferase